MDIQKAFVLFFAFFTFNLDAAQSTPSPSKLSISAAVGSLNGTANEYVYLPQGARLSHLIWDMQDDPIFKAAGRFQFNSWVNFNLSGWINMGHGNGLMNDYDWALPITHYSDWSNHPNTDLRQANEVDINVSADFLHLQQLDLAVMLGYQRNLYSFLAKGGCYDYSFGTVVGCFAEDLPVIGYRQAFSAPYIGLVGIYTAPLWQLEANIKYSNRVAGRDKDQHYLRDLTFYEGSNNFTFYNMSLNAGYFFSPQLKLFAEGTLNYITKRKMGSIMINNLANERTDFVGPVAGFSNYNYILAAGLNYYVDS